MEAGVTDRLWELEDIVSLIPKKGDSQDSDLFVMVSNPIHLSRERQSWLRRLH